MQCAVFSCYNKYSKRNQNVSYYSFPRKDRALLKKWVRFCKRKDKFNRETFRICSEHFIPNDFERNLKFEMGISEKDVRKLKPGSIPSVYSVRNLPISDTKQDRINRVQNRSKQSKISSLLKDVTAKSTVTSNVHIERTQPRLMEVDTNEKETQSLAEKLNATVKRDLQMDLVCRTCLNVSNDMKSIFMNDGGENISEMLQSCSELIIHALDGFPTTICSDCLIKLHISYSFRQQCAISNNALVNCMGTKLVGDFDTESKIARPSETGQSITELITGTHPSPSSHRDDEMHETKVEVENLVVSNGNAIEVPAMDVGDIKNEKFVISSGSEIFVINFKDECNDEESSNENRILEIENKSDTSFVEPCKLHKSGYNQHMKFQCIKTYSKSFNLQRHRKVHSVETP